MPVRSFFRFIAESMLSAVGKRHGGFYRSYSQLGEDAMLRGFMHERWEDKNYKGFWVDIGAYDPTRFSNTRMFSERGWRGINVDAMAEAIDLFNTTRKKDINVNVGIGQEKGELDYYMFASRDYNTFSKDFADDLMRNDGFVLKDIKKVPVITMEELLDAYLPTGQHIDFITIDAEGLDLEILQSNNWNKYSADFILIEIDAKCRNVDIPQSPVAEFLRTKGYEFVGQGLWTTLFRKMSV